MNAKQLVNNFLELQRGYQLTRRALLTKERFKDIANSDLAQGLDIKGNSSLKEALIEHVGHLPIIATFFHAHIVHSKEVDLGRVLIMLSIHDIAETKLGDIFAYSKTHAESDDELKVAREMLSPELWPFFDEFEAGKTLDAKYAKSVDALAPGLHELDMPRITIKRFMAHGFTIDDIVKRNRQRMEWDPLLLQVFDLHIQQFRAVENNTELIFPTVPYDLKSF